MKLSNVRPFLLSACFLLAVALVATLLSSCDGNHIIGDEPDPCFVEAECVDTVVEELCPECEIDCTDWARLSYERGLEDGAASVTCDECDVDVVETDTDTCDLSVPVGHRPIECRGKGHSSLRCDKNCGEFDPICIPCDLQVA